jgi:hypothetical protein
MTANELIRALQRLPAELREKPVKVDDSGVLRTVLGVTPTERDDAFFIELDHT